MKIALLTNSKISIPAINYLAGRNFISCIGIPGNQKNEDIDFVTYHANMLKIPLIEFNKKDFAVHMSQWLHQYTPDVVLVFTFPYKIPSSLLDFPLKGFINFHFGLLPGYRGADPIFWQIRNGEKEGGISVHQMDKSYDTGSVYFVLKTPLFPGVTYGSHLLSLSNLSVEAVQKLLPLLQSTVAPVIAQNNQLATYYHRPGMKDLLIRWDNSAETIIALINAANPWNKGGITYINGYALKIIAASKVPASSISEALPAAGTIAYADEIRGLLITCGNNQLLRLDIIYCNDSFMTGVQLTRLGIGPGTRFEELSHTQVA